MSILDSARVQRWLARFQLCRVEGVAARFALSFDDGPSPRNTPALLDTLARLHARATFFVLAARARRHADLVRRAHEEGHEIGIHGREHLPPLLLPPPLFAQQFHATAAAVEAACGVRPRRYRAPFGWLTPVQARQARTWGFEPVLGDVYPDDPHVKIGSVIAERTLAKLAPGSIVILHDSSVLGDASRSPTIEAVERVVVAARARGLAAVSVGELVAERDRGEPNSASHSSAAPRPFV